jgi:hypothetical protein
MPVKNGLIRMPLNYIVALQSGPCLDGQVDTLTTYPAGTILPFLGSEAPQGWRVATELKAPDFYAKRSPGGWDIDGRWLDLKSKIHDMHKHAVDGLAS